jgi:hypothetical protein
MITGKLGAGGSGRWLQSKAEAVAATSRLRGRVPGRSSSLLCGLIRS